VIPGEVIEHRRATPGAHAPSTVAVAEQRDDGFGRMSAPTRLTTDSSASDSSPTDLVSR
jgi:hypothetical protein